jgi:hypothetical protein
MKKTLLMVVLAIAIMLVAAATATADQAIVPGAGSPLSAADTVNVSATVNARLLLTVDTPDVGQTVAFGNVTPGNTYNAPVTVNVKSNRLFDLTIGKAGQVAQLGFTTTVADSLAHARGDHNFADDYQLQVPWDTAPGAYAASVTYTVVQN